MRWQEQHTWNIIFTVLFAAVVLGAYRHLLVLQAVPRSVPAFDMVLLALATFRLVRLFVYDHITEWVRDLFVDVHESNGETIMSEPATGPRKTLGTLFGCPWCFGLWAAFVVVYAYFLTPHAYFFVLVLAIAGVGTLLQLFANLLGWSAEHTKRTTESLTE